MLGRRRCRKRRYVQRVDALIALADIQRRDRPTARERRAYFCGVCHGYHLTSQPKKEHPQ